MTPKRPENPAIRARNRRNYAIAGALLVFVVLVFVVTLANYASHAGHG